MATIITGKSRCSVCNKTFEEGDDLIVIPQFTANAKDPLYFLSGVVMHKHCYLNHPQKKEIDKIIRNIERLSAQPIMDHITGELIDYKSNSNADNIVNIGPLTSDESSPLYPYNNIVFDKKNINKWEDFNKFITLLEQYDQSDKWEGPYLKSLINILKSPAKPDYDPAFLERMRAKYGR